MEKKGRGVAIVVLSIVLFHCSPISPSIEKTSSGQNDFDYLGGGESVLPVQLTQTDVATAVISSSQETAWEDAVKLDPVHLNSFKLNGFVTLLPLETVPVSLRSA